MDNIDSEIQSIREELKFYPNNLHLRKHIANLLFSKSLFDEAEKEFRQALMIFPHNQNLKLGLAKTFFHQGNTSASLVLVEDILKNPDLSFETYILYARLLHITGNNEKAIEKYRFGVKNDPLLNDPELEDLLGIDFSDEYEEINSENDIFKLYSKSENISFPDEISEVSEKPAITFEDVGGMDKLKEEIQMKIIFPLSHPEIYKVYGKKTGGGILLYGPPGCGKTYLARATAGEIKAKFISVGIYDVLDMWIGQSERNLHEVFEYARNINPSVLFFDEVDALGASRTDMKQSGGRHLINQFLSELDGVKDSNEGVLILAATNAPWHLDSAFRRPGRFDRILFVPPPDLEARVSILKILLKDKPVKDIDYYFIAKKTDNFSGADLKAVVEITIEEKLREAMKKGVTDPITSKEILLSVKRISPSTKEWFNTARNYALYSNQGGIYDDILSYLKLK